MINGIRAKTQCLCKFIQNELIQNGHLNQNCFDAIYSLLFFSFFCISLCSETYISISLNKSEQFIYPIRCMIITWSTVIACYHFCNLIIWSFQFQLCLTFKYFFTNALSFHNMRTQRLCIVVLFLQIKHWIAT